MRSDVSGQAATNNNEMSRGHFQCSKLELEAFTPDPIKHSGQVFTLNFPTSLPHQHPPPFLSWSNNILTFKYESQ